MQTKTATPDITEAVGKYLQETLVDLIDLGLQAKQAHWNVKGPFFKPVHEHLDEMYDEYQGWIDEVAERAIAIDVTPDGRAGVIADTTALESFPAGRVADTEVVSLMAERLGQVAERIGERCLRIGDDDLVSQDLLIEIKHGLDKQRWMLRSQLI